MNTFLRGLDDVEEDPAMMDYVLVYPVTRGQCATRPFQLRLLGFDNIHLRHKFYKMIRAAGYVIDDERTTGWALDKQSANNIDWDCAKIWDRAGLS